MFAKLPSKDAQVAQNLRGNWYEPKWKQDDRKGMADEDGSVYWRFPLLNLRRGGKKFPPLYS